MAVMPRFSGASGRMTCVGATERAPRQVPVVGGVMPARTDPRSRAWSLRTSSSEVPGCRRAERPVRSTRTFKETYMPTRIAINGFGRIGRAVLRAALERDVDYEIVAVND